MAATNTRATLLELGSTLLAPSAHGPAGPAGTTHLVDGWQPVCGGDRVRFVFPGRVVDGATCPDCMQVVAPPQRSTGRPAAARSRTRAS